VRADKPRVKSGPLLFAFRDAAAADDVSLLDDVGLAPERESEREVGKLGGGACGGGGGGSAGNPAHVLHRRRRHRQAGLSVCEGART